MSNNRLHNYEGPRDIGTDDTGHPLAESITPTFQRLGGVLESQIRKNPVASLAIGLTLGVALGWLVKRR